MTHALSNHEHYRWGLPVHSYPKLYTKHRIAASLQPSNSLVLAKHTDWRSIAIATIGDICKLDQLTPHPHVIETAAARITLHTLKSVLELTRFPSEFVNFALPSLIAGSIVLMSSVQPTPFSYEYGYLCFRILVFSLNTCLIKHGRNLDYTIQRMSSAAPGRHLSFFWQGAADLLIGELGSIARLEKRLTQIVNHGPQQFPVLELPKLDMLLNVLHRDRKQFLVALMTADSLQLSSLLFILWKYLEHEKYAKSFTYSFNSA
ncbi:unnamed protein product [Rhizoctonia solani]|uniref:Uncharacterized protein n=1 Tax=Rhizoctonia solani TaxID=456999 RepID=A0A8H3BE63_9AGAM|nr:unnamed protein product [Rhizoctonia solani]